jgi:hypothetical protein
MVYKYEVQYPVLVKWIANNREKWNEIAKVNMRLHYIRHKEAKLLKDNARHRRNAEWKRLRMIDIY